jgi:hypothetical protein
VVHTCNPSYSNDGGRSILNSKPSWAKLARPHLKKQIKTNVLAQVVEQHKALGIPSTTKETLKFYIKENCK